MSYECTCPADYEHGCPYAEDVHGDYEFVCLCCEDCEAECAQSI